MKLEDFNSSLSQGLNEEASGLPGFTFAVNLTLRDVGMPRTCGLVCLSSNWVRVLRSVTSCIDCPVPLLALSLSAGFDLSPGGMCLYPLSSRLGLSPAGSRVPGTGTGVTFGGHFPAVTSRSCSTRSSSSKQGWNFGPFQLTFCSPDVRCEPLALGWPSQPA